MMSQIQPHFLYNTLATIRALCCVDAEKAGEMTEKFGEYLRQNLDSLGNTGLIPFRKELEHTRIYADIEMVCFENLRVEYDIQDDAFALPPLTLQPIVENAFTHGFREAAEKVLRIEVEVKNALIIRVTNSGATLSPQEYYAVNQAIRGNTAHGLSMVNHKLQGAYDERYDIRIGDRKSVV